MKKLAAAFIVATLGAAALGAARESGADRLQAGYTSGNIGYDGKLAFVRLRYSNSFGGFGRRGGRELPWAHDYPTADIHLMKIIKDLTSTEPHVDGSNIYSLDDPELMNHPISYMSEPGFWTLSDSEALGLRTYLQKGGFIIFDDFRGNDWFNLEEQMKRVIPEGRFVEIDVTHPIFHSFFDIKDLHFLTSYNGLPTYWAMFEDNDPSKRIIAIANRDNDLGEYWEYSDTGADPIDFTNESYKFGVNYWMYGLTR